MNATNSRESKICFHNSANFIGVQHRTGKLEKNIGLPDIEYRTAWQIIESIGRSTVEYGLAKIKENIWLSNIGLITQDIELSNIEFKGRLLSSSPHWLSSGSGNSHAAKR